MGLEPGQMTKKQTKAGTTKPNAVQKQALWIEAMLTNGGNATQAAVSAGFKKGEAAKKAGHRLSTNVHVAAELARRQKEVLEHAMEISGLTVDRTLKEVARLAYFDPRKLYTEDGNLKPVSEWDDDTAAGIASIEVLEEFEGRGEDRVAIGLTKKLKVWDKNAALDKAMKHLGQYEKDNSQKVDPITELLAAVAERGAGLQVKR